jgi:hypothetical protein
MRQHEASRTLVKSPPELWAELSDEASLAGHLAEPFGEIRITRLEPETAVAWEGERASGTVRIEPSGWGTRVTLTARAVQAESTPSDGQPKAPAPEPEPPLAPKPLPPAAVAPEPATTSEAPRRGLRGLLLGWLKGKPAAPPPPGAAAPPPLPVKPETPNAGPAPRAEAKAPEAPEASVTPAFDPGAVLLGVLDSLGAAHHRPFSRS